VHLSSFRVSNYKSFRDSKKVRLEPGFNVVVGANNAGKTALAEALSLKYSDKPHRSFETVPVPSASPDPVSQVEVAFELSREEFLEVLEGIPQPFLVPILPRDPSNIDVRGWARRFLDAVRDINRIEYVRRSDGLSSAYLTAYDVRPAPNSSVQALMFQLDTPSKELGPSFDGVPQVPAAGTFEQQAAGLLAGRVYYFKAERLNLGDSTAVHVQELAPDASNLAACLHTLQSNPARFRRLNTLLGDIFEEVRQVAVPLSQDGRVRILLWSIDPVSEREDLAVPLSESGTGIGQVLAILYVVLTAERSKTIIIDEPQSFLHPGAVRKLIEILKHYERARHQYVITTHSPTVINAAEPRMLLAVRKEGAESIVEQIDALETREQELLLREVGARLSDVFGADDILWVEGHTEETCFPLILSKVARRPLLGTKILGVVQTGDFESKHSETILEIYRRLSEGRGLLPPAVGFIFDREDRDEGKREDLERLSGGKVVFTGRRMFENYLLNSSAIAAVASNIEGFREGIDIEPKEVSRWLEKHRWDNKYFGKTMEKVSRTEEVWSSDVHGAKLLGDMFQDLSETRIFYDKVEHGTALTRWLCDKAPEDLRDIERLIEDRLDNPISR